MGKRFSKGWLVRQCEGLRDHIRARGLTDEATLAAAMPGKDATTIDWVKAYGTLRAWVWQEDDLPSRSDEAEERMLQALLEEPEEVKLTTGEVVCVYPKGLRALLWFRHRDWFIGWLAARIQVIREASDSGSLREMELEEPVTALEDAEAELASQLAKVAAVACSEGPALVEPDSADADGRFADLDPVDLYRIHKAFQEVNAGRMEAMQRIVKPRKQGQGNQGRMSWNVFEGTLAMRLKTDPKTLADNQSLVSQLAQVGLAGPQTGHEEIEDL